jgi:hypothetical protein
LYQIEVLFRSRHNDVLLIYLKSTYVTFQVANLLCDGLVEIEAVAQVGVQTAGSMYQLN